MMSLRIGAAVLLVLSLSCTTGYVVGDEPPPVSGDPNCPAPPAPPTCDTPAPTVCEQCEHSVVPRTASGTQIYRAIDNPVSLLTSGVASDCLVATTSVGTVVQDGTDLVVSGATGDSLTLTLTSSGENCPDFAEAIDLDVIPLPKPAPVFAGASYGDRTIKKSSLTAAQGVAAKAAPPLDTVKYTVIGFAVTFIVGGTPITKVSSGNRLTSDMKTMLKRAKPGQMLFVHNIRAKGRDGLMHSLGGLSLKVN